MRYVLPVILFALLAPPAHAYPKLPQPLPPVKGNPANKLLNVPIDDSIYEGATKQEPPQRRHHEAGELARRAHPRSVLGSYRCEKWGRHSASLHAEIAGTGVPG
jgi:hypothetical protein